MKPNSLLITKHKKSKHKKLKLQGSVGFSQKKVEYYVLTHHKIKSELGNGQYKNVFDMLFDMDPPQKSYLPLFYQDQLFAVSKLLKYHTLRKQLNSESVVVCFKKGKQVIPKLYELFVRDQSLQGSLKAVNENMGKELAKFLTVLTYFIMECAYMRFKQEKMVEAMLLYSILYDLTQKIVDSATSDRKVLRKVGEALLAYASFLINTNDLSKAVEVLLLALKNESNILLTLSCRLKTTSKTVYRRNISEVYSRLFAIFFNLAYICQTKKQVRLSFMFLNECRQISQLKMKVLAKDANPHFVDFFQNCQKFHQEYAEVASIVENYFSEAQLKADMVPSLHRHRGSQDSELLQASNAGTIAKICTVQAKMQNSSNRKKILKKSVSLKDKLHCTEDEKYYKNFGHQFLFYGVKLFDKYSPQDRKRNFSNTNFSKSSYLQTHEEILATNEQQKSRIAPYAKAQSGSSNLKRKVKRNNFFRQIQEPIQYEVLKQRFAKMWREDEVQVHKTHEQMCLLNYKNHNSNFGGLHKENKTAHEEIKLMNRRPQVRISSKPKRSDSKDIIRESGSNLFKRILLMKSKVLGIKKTETLNILRRKTTTVCVSIEEGYSSPVSSVEFVKGQLEARQERYTASKIASKIEDEIVGKGTAIQRIFLTKDAVEIPNLFLSYITRSTVETQFLAVILEYGLWLVRVPYRFQK